MLHSQCHHHLLFPLTLAHHKVKPPLSILPPLLHHKPTILHSVSASAIPPWLAQLADAAADIDFETEGEGPVELPFSSTPSIFATADDPSPIQVASSVLLTGAVSVFLFRSLRRRAQRVKQSVTTLFSLVFFFIPRLSERKKLYFLKVVLLFIT